VKPSQLKPWIGKRIQWLAYYDSNRGSGVPRSGILDAVKGRNVMVDGDWKWLPTMIDIKLAAIHPICTQRNRSIALTRVFDASAASGTLRTKSPHTLDARMSSGERC
jgi:hypothetical protein